MKTKIVEATDECIYLGRKGENLATTIKFPIPEELRGYTAKILYRPVPDNIGTFASIVVQEAEFVSMIVTSEETATAGTGELQLLFYKGETLKKSKVYSYYVSDSIC